MDVFALCTADAAYSALFERGYMAELTDSAPIAQMVQAMYPAIQNAVCKEGEVYALPVEMHTGRGDVYKRQPMCWMSASAAWWCCAMGCMAARRSPSGKWRNAWAFRARMYPALKKPRWKN